MILFLRHVVDFLLYLINQSLQGRVCSSIVSQRMVEAYLLSEIQPSCSPPFLGVTEKGIHQEVPHALVTACFKPMLVIKDLVRIKQCSWHYFFFCFPRWEGQGEGQRASSVLHPSFFGNKPFSLASVAEHRWDWYEARRANLGELPCA